MKNSAIIYTVKDTSKDVKIRRKAKNMLRYKNILVPYDGSDHAEKALSQAIDMVKNSSDCTLHVASICNMVAAVRKSDQASIAEGRLTAELAEESEIETKEALEKAKKQIPQEIPANMIYEIGSPTQVLLEIADKYNCDLIVMGSRGLGPIKGIFMGSVSSYLASHAKIPVCIVK